MEPKGQCPEPGASYLVPVVERTLASFSVLEVSNLVWFLMLGVEAGLCAGYASAFNTE